MEEVRRNKNGERGRETELENQTGRGTPVGN